MGTARKKNVLFSPASLIRARTFQVRSLRLFPMLHIVKTSFMLWTVESPSRLIHVPCFGMKTSAGMTATDSRLVSQSAFDWCSRANLGPPPQGIAFYRPQNSRYNFFCIFLWQILYFHFLPNDEFATTSITLNCYWQYLSREWAI